MVAGRAVDVSVFRPAAELLPVRRRSVNPNPPGEYIKDDASDAAFAKRQKIPLNQYFAASPA
jgi:hypothetical protein